MEDIDWEIEFYQTALNSGDEEEAEADLEEFNRLDGIQIE
jgi:hypothetical protein